MEIEELETAEPAAPGNDWDAILQPLFEGEEAAPEIVAGEAPEEMPLFSEIQRAAQGLSCGGAGGHVDDPPWSRRLHAELQAAARALSPATAPRVAQWLDCNRDYKVAHRCGRSREVKVVCARVVEAM